MNKLELLENFDKANNGTYNLDDLAELIVEAYELGSDDVYEKIEPVRQYCNELFERGLGIDASDPRFTARLVATQVLNYLDGEE